MLQEVLKGFGLFVGYYAVMAGGLLLLRGVLKPPRELFRKLLHMVCALSIFVLVYAVETWYGAMLAALLFAAALYPLITWLEKHTKFLEMLTQRREGEIRSSLLLVFFMMALLIAVIWGWFGEEWRFLIITAVLTWGLGDAAAALVGKQWGRNPFNSKWLDGKKTREGTAAMLLASALALAVCLAIYTNLPWHYCLLSAVLVAPFSAGAELFTRKGMDTLTVPIATAVPLVALMFLFARMGILW